MSHDFTLCNLDTDSIMVCKSDMTVFTKEEQTNLLKELNSLFEEHIKFEPDGEFQTAIIVKTKNYVLHDPSAVKEKDRLKIKGSALKASMKEVSLKEFIAEFINIMLRPDFKIQEPQALVDLYHSYVKEIKDLKDMSRWSAKKTLTDSALAGETATSLKILLALKHEEGYQLGDKIRVFFLPDDTLCLEQNFNGEYNCATLLEKLYKTVVIFETVVDKSLFLNYSLKRNIKKIDDLT